MNLLNRVIDAITVLKPEQPMQNTSITCSGGCGRIMDVYPIPDYHSPMLPMTMDGVPRYTCYKYLSSFTCNICCLRGE